MKIPTLFGIRRALLALAMVSVLPATAQQTPTSPVPTSADEMTDMSRMRQIADKPKTRSASLTVTLGGKTLTLQPSDLAAMPHETVTAVNGHTKASETYSGVPVSALLAKLGLPFEKANEHTLLKTYFVAEGTDGYQVLVSTYETLSAIRGVDAVIADTLDGKLLEKDGAFKLVIPGDKRPQRWVQNLKSLTFRTVE